MRFTHDGTPHDARHIDGLKFVALFARRTQLKLHILPLNQVLVRVLVPTERRVMDKNVPLVQRPHGTDRDEPKTGLVVEPLYTSRQTRLRHWLCSTMSAHSLDPF